MASVVPNLARQGPLQLMGVSFHLLECDRLTVGENHGLNPGVVTCRPERCLALHLEAGFQELEMLLPFDAGVDVPSFGQNPSLAIAKFGVMPSEPLEGPGHPRIVASHLIWNDLSRCRSAEGEDPEGPK